MDSIKIVAQKLEYVCDSCDPDSQKVAQLYCKTCNIFLCKECDQSLHQMRAFKGHIKCSSNQGYLERFRSCKLHENSSLILYCESCKQFVCETCQKDGNHSFHRMKGALDWDNIFPAFLSLGKKDIDSILNRIDNNISGIKKSQGKLDELFTKYFGELEKSRTLILEYYKKEMEKETNKLSFFENLKLCGPEILEDKFFIRYSHSLQKNSVFTHEQSEKLLKIAEEELQKNAAWFSNLFNVNSFYYWGEFTESQFTTNKCLSLSNHSRTVTKVSTDNVWYPCLVQTDLTKCSIKIDKTSDSQIMIGITNTDHLKSNKTQDSQTLPTGGVTSTTNLFGKLHTNSLSGDNIILATQSQKNPLLKNNLQISLENNIHSKVSSCTYSGSGNGSIILGSTSNVNKQPIASSPYANSNNSIGLFNNAGGSSNTTAGLNEGLKAGDLIEISYDKKSSIVVFSKNEKTFYQILWEYLQEPCFFVQLYQNGDTVTVS